jgi:putative heme-binding domain-containing protein
VNNAGGKIGPDLSVVGRGLPIDMIVTEVLWPAINVKEGYEAATVTMRDGTVVTGFKQADTAEAIAIRDMNTNAITTIRRADTKEIRTGGTVMPDGLTGPLSPKQLGSLIRYLSELGK